VFKSLTKLEFLKEECNAKARLLTFCQFRNENLGAAIA
jgi:hypothetical protein